MLSGRVTAAGAAGAAVTTGRSTTCAKAAAGVNARTAAIAALADVEV
jgi:hypothetical protein